MIAFRHPLTDQVETYSFGSSFFGCLLFGCFYFAYKGAWLSAAISGVVAILTGGASWLIYPFFAPMIVRNNYVTHGWEKVSLGAVRYQETI